jgi:hypothetical protein
MEKLAEALAELRVVFAALLENSVTESKALPQIEAPSCTGLKCEAPAKATDRDRSN